MLYYGLKWIDSSCGGHDLKDVRESNTEEWDQDSGERLPDYTHIASPYIGFKGEYKIEILNKLVDEFYEERSVADPRYRIAVFNTKVRGQVVGCSIRNAIGEINGAFKENEYRDLKLFIDEHLESLQKEFKDFAEYIFTKYEQGFRVE